jgi:quinol monooxygenase YgiN
MRPFAHLLLAMALASLAAMPAARAQDANDPAVYMISYVEVMPSATKQTASLLKALLAASRKEANGLRFEVLQRMAPSSQFGIVEVWKDQAALDAHTAAAHTKQFRDALQPLLLAPVDERLCNAISVSAMPAAGGASSLYAMNHVDIVGPNPANRDAFIPVLKAFSEASRKAAGNLRYDVIQQKTRTNHFQVVEVWKDQKSDDAHEVSTSNRDFRAKLAPAGGALYDQRWYKAL